jgi:hypothetical protein
MGQKRNAYSLLMGKPVGKRPLGRQRRRWVHNVRMDLGEMGWEDVDYIGPVQDRSRWRNAGKISSGLTSSGLSRIAKLHRVS